MSERDYEGRNSKWDREHFERSMDTVRDNQADPTAEVGGTNYQGGVFSSGTYGSGAEFYSVTGMYDNPLLQNKGRESHRGKGPRGYSRSDERIAEEVCDRLTHHPLVDASQMDVKVEKGEVTLSGEILDRRMKHLAEDLTAEVTGVKEIHNQLRLVRTSAA